jgi:hypothetical protein
MIDSAAFPRGRGECVMLNKGPQMVEAVASLQTFCAGCSLARIKKPPGYVHWDWPGGSSFHARERVPALLDVVT